MELPLGTETIDVSLPDCEVEVAEPAGGDPVDVRAAAERALEIVEDCLMRAEDDAADALEASSEVLVVPDTLNTLLVDGDR